VSKQDEEYLQPRLRFSNVTDQQRMRESAMSFDERVGKIYRRFEASKSRLGRTMRESMDRYSDGCSSGVQAEGDKKRSRSLWRRSPREEQPEDSLVGSTKLS
jgi:hypothetical protein